MKTGSANDYITVFRSMMSGEEYHRTINTFATEYYFVNIYKDYGKNFLIERLTHLISIQDTTVSKGRDIYVALKN